MAVFREILRLTIPLLIAALSFSCSPKSVLVVTDPYIETFQGRRWGPATIDFFVKARLAGYRVFVDIAEDQNEFKTIVESQEKVPNIVLVSPLNASGIAHVQSDVEKYIIVGKAPEADAPGDSQIIRVELDRRMAMEEIGFLAAEIASVEKKPAMALFSSSNSKRDMEIESLKKSYFSESGEELEVITVNSLSDELPSHFSDTAVECSLLLLFAGPANIIAMEKTEEQGIPVITESLGIARSWQNRIVASVEDDQKSLNKALLKMMDNEERTKVIGYPAKIKQ